MVYIFSNAHTYPSISEFGTRIREDFKVNNEDKLVFLNTTVPLQAATDYFEKLGKDYNNIYCILRAFPLGKLHFYWGVEWVARHRYMFNTIYLLNHNWNINTGFDTFVTSIDPKTEDTVELEIDNTFIDNYPNKDQMPTAGFYAYHLVQQFFRTDQITLVNFYGSSNNSTPKWNGHNWNFEEEYFKDKPKIFV